MNGVRVPLVVQAFSASGSDRGNSVRDCGRPLSGAKILDVGCGGGILSEALARLGANVTGVDASAANVRAAQLHASHDPALAAPALQYTCNTAEALAAGPDAGSFDVVVASEVIEHVADTQAFVEALAALLKVSTPISCARHDVAAFLATRFPAASASVNRSERPPSLLRPACCTRMQPGGHLVFTTINRTVASFGAAILGAEYVLRLVPAGTHEWTRFVTPQELTTLVRKAGLDTGPADTTGLLYHPLGQYWEYVSTTLVNYALTARKPSGAVEAVHPSAPGSVAPAPGEARGGGTVLDAPTAAGASGVSGATAGIDSKRTVEVTVS